MPCRRLALRVTGHLPLISRATPSLIAFAVFDGHGGKRAAVACLRDVAGRLLMGGPAKWNDDAICDAFWDADLALGASRTMDGTTATVLLVEDAGGSAPLQCVLAWVGDSAAIHVDMLGAKADGDLLVKHATELHVPDNEAEVVRLRTEWAVRQHVHKNWDWVMRELLHSSLPPPQQQPRRSSAVGDSADAPQSPQPSFRKSVLAASKAYRQTLAALKEVQSREDVPAEDVHLYMRILHREHLMALAGQPGPTEEPPPQPSPASRASVKFAAGATSGAAKAEETRRRSTIARRFGDHGPVSLKASKVIRIARAPTTILEMPSTLVTRSIGDWDASRACIPHPSILRFELPRGAHARIVIASDGLWDFATHAKAATLVRAAKSAQAAADRLTRLAWETSHAKFERLKDDTTAIVVELDCRGAEARRAAAARAAAAPSGSCACAVQ